MFQQPWKGINVDSLPSPFKISRPRGELWNWILSGFFLAMLGVLTNYNAIPKS